MRTLSSILIIVVFGFIAQWYLPWWTIALVCFVIGMSINRSWWSSLIGGFVGVGLLWMLTLIFQMNGNEGVLIERMSNLLPISSGFAIYGLTLLIGALVGALSCFTGYSLHFIKAKKERKSKYHF